MKQYHLTDQEKKTYNRIKLLKKWGLMFQFGFVIGQERTSKEFMNSIKNT